MAEDVDNGTELGNVADAMKRIRRRNAEGMAALKKYFFYALKQR